MCDSSTFLQHWCPENKANQRFEAQNVQQFYVFATLMSRKQSKTTIWSPKCATVLRFCNTDVRKTKQNNDFTTKMCDSSTFLQHWCPENKAKQRFHDQNVRQFYVFETLMSGKQSKTTIWSPKCATVLRFCNTDVRKTKQNNDSTTISEKTKKEQKTNTARAIKERTKTRERETPKTMRRRSGTRFWDVL